MSTSITRRAALTGSAAGAAAIVAGTLPAIAIAADHPDAELFALGRQHDAIYAKMKDAERRMDIVAPLGPKPIEPEALKVRPGDEALGMPKPYDYGVGGPDNYNWREVNELKRNRRVRPYRGPVKLERVEYADVPEIVTAAIAYSNARDEPWPEAQARADEIVSAFEAYDAERKCPEYDCEAVAEIEKEIDGYYDELRPVDEAIVAMRAVTLDGLLVKARAVRWMYHDDPEEIMVGTNGTDHDIMCSITADLWAMQEGQS